MRFVQLCAGVKMPMLGLGTFKIQGRDTIHQVLDAALAAGYRSLDTAAVYHNEEDIGKSLKVLLPQHGLSRQDIFITSKLAPRDQGQGICREACLQSLSRLQCSYLDLFLIHWPGTQGQGRKKIQPQDPVHKQNRLGSWTDLEQLYKEGLVKTIGVSNFLQHHLEELMKSCTVKPALLQIEFHPHLVQTDLLHWCKQHDIHFQAYSSLGTSSENNKLLTNPTVQAVAKSMHRTPAQVLLRWAVQQGVGILPKSTNVQHIKENTEVFDFELSDHDMQTLTSLGSDTHYCWDPTAVA